MLLDAADEMEEHMENLTSLNRHFREPLDFFCDIPATLTDTDTDGLRLARHPKPCRRSRVSRWAAAGCSRALVSEKKNAKGVA